MTDKSDGFANLVRQTLEHVAREMEQVRDFPGDYLVRAESPIEDLLFSALVALTRFCDSEYHHVVVPSRIWPLARLLDQPDLLTLIVEPQAQLEGWRVDFLVHAWETGRISGKEQWRRLIVECDGHAFHERTKEQAARDRSRDREFQLRGYTVLRFTGSEIHNDPLGCARQISDWGSLGW
jgi:very-short-patch-repair endonuclease